MGLFHNGTISQWYYFTMVLFHNGTISQWYYFTMRGTILYSIYFMKLIQHFLQNTIKYRMTH